MTAAPLLLLMSLVTAPLSSSISVTPNIRIAEIPSEFAPFREIGCDRYVNVFGVHIFAGRTTPDVKLTHAAGVLAQYLDNDEDGVPDDLRVLSELVSRNVFIIMPGTEAEMETLDIERVEDAGFRYGQDLYGEETDPDFLTDGKIHAADGGSYDGALEEILHPITAHGYANAYPDAFGTDPGSRLARCMDTARGGHFQQIPTEGPKEGYPADAWYHYTDETCDYACMVTEYVYWALTSLLGTQDFPGRHEALKVEWELNTGEKLRTQDPAVTALLTDPTYNVPTRAPDGNYAPTAAPVTTVPIVPIADDE